MNCAFEKSKSQHRLSFQTSVTDDHEIVELPAPDATVNVESVALSVASGAPMSLRARLILAEWTK